MAFSLNRVQLIGNVTRDPEIRQTSTGQTVASLGLATNFAWTDASGQRQEKVEFHNIVAWRRLAEVISQYVKKGSKLYVEGRLQTRDWEGPDGVKRYRTEIVLDNMIMLDSRRDATAAGGAGMAGMGSAPRQESYAPVETTAKSVSAKKAPANKTASDEMPEPSEDEVTIDDLPF